MSNTTDKPAVRKPLRLWPGVVTVVLLLLVRFVIPVIVPGGVPIGIIGGLVGALIIIVWWVFFSRAPWWERVGAIAVMAIAVILTRRILHQSVAKGMMGMMFFIYVIPVLSLALVAWAAATRQFSARIRFGSMIAAILIACGFFALLRTGGITGEAASDFHWRWAKTPEERLLAESGQELASPSLASAPPSPGAETVADWPGFRGPARDGIVRGLRIATNWTAAPPLELWRRPVGPGWSSFAVHGNRFYTQEQRGDEEVVACYELTTGRPIWKHSDAARFWESNAGPGPRATPTVSHDRVYALGATGILNALNASDGSLVWTRNVASDTGKKIPGWGFAGSPLVVDDLIVVAAGGMLAAFELSSGKERWFGPTNGWGYSSPQLSKIGGVEQILLLNGAGAISLSPADGKLLWEHEWKGDGVVQAALTADGDVLIGTGSGLGSGARVGVRRIGVTRGADKWTTQERWTSTGLKPYFNDFVLHAGHAYGFDNGLLACIDLSDGKRKWKGGRYGHGQLILLADQELLLVLSEQGELALVAAVPDDFKELARHPALKGKTWNHPVLVGDVLLARNDQEMAAFRLSPGGG